MVLQGANLWVTNPAGPSVTEINATTGAFVRLVVAERYELKGESGSIAAGGGDIWVVTSDHITEINPSTGAVVRIVLGPTYGFDVADEIAWDGSHLWVTNADSNSVTEMSATNGSLVRLVSNFVYGFDSPSSISSDGSDVWVGNAAVATVTGFPVA
jgi:hypothetical protein